MIKNKEVGLCSTLGRHTPFKGPLDVSTLFVYLEFIFQINYIYILEFIFQIRFCHHEPSVCPSVHILFQLRQPNRWADMAEISQQRSSPYWQQGLQTSFWSQNFR